MYTSVKFSVKALSIEGVREILVECGYESVLDHIEESNGAYVLKKPIRQISALPSYQYALCATLMALGNSKMAQDEFEVGWSLMGPGGQTDVSYMLGRLLTTMYSKSE